MKCPSCGRDNLTHNDKCPDCEPQKREWPKGWLSTRLEELENQQRDKAGVKDLPYELTHRPDRKDRGSVLSELIVLFVLAMLAIRVVMYFVKQ